MPARVRVFRGNADYSVVSRLKSFCDARPRARAHPAPPAPRPPGFCALVVLESATTTGSEGSFRALCLLSPVRVDGVLYSSSRRCPLRVDRASFRPVFMRFPERDMRFTRAKPCSNAHHTFCPVFMRVRALSKCAESPMFKHVFSNMRFAKYSCGCARKTWVSPAIHAGPRKCVSPSVYAGPKQGVLKTSIAVSGIHGIFRA